MLNIDSVFHTLYFLFLILFCFVLALLYFSGTNKKYPLLPNVLHISFNYIHKYLHLISL